VLLRPRPSATTVRRLALASLAVLTLIVVTGAAVRLTASGLGCPTWPRCTDDSFVTQPEMGAHGLIEFGNRLLTFVVGAVVLATTAAAALHRPRRPELLRLGLLLLAGVVAQGVLGGITVLTGLHPLTVAAHFLLSMVLLVGAVALHVRSGEPAGPTRPVVHPAVRGLGRLLVATTAATLVVGTLVTGSGPHSGDPGAERLPLDPTTISQVHADVVFLMLGLTVAMSFVLRATGAPALARRRALVLLGVTLAQGTVGYVQYVTGLPVLLVGAHVLGACLVWIAVLRLQLAFRAVEPAADAAAPAVPLAAPREETAPLARV